MGGCSAQGCNNSAAKGYRMCKFPRDMERRREWVKKMKRNKWKPTDNCCLCEIHFEPHMWERTRMDGTKKLKRDAVPTIFTFLNPPKKRRIEESSDSDTISRPSSTSSSAQSTDSSDAVEIQMSENEKMPLPQNPTTVSRLYNPFSLNKQPQPFPNTYPIHQDVTFSKLPFYDVIAELLKPSSLIPKNNQLVQESTFFFVLSPQQTTDILESRSMKSSFVSDFEKQVQLRFCLSETICEQEDFFPQNLVVKVNNRMCSLPPLVPTNKPGLEPKRPSKPVNITPYVKLTATAPNTLTVLWTSDIGPGFSVAINLVKKLSADDLVKRLKAKGEMNSDYTRSLIKEKLNESDAEIVTTCLRVSLLCPLGKMRMITPCRATTCQHLQCFDASLYIQMNEKKATWGCPVCDKPALYCNLIIDGYFKDVLSSSSLPYEINEIELNKDGSWSIHNQNRNTSSGSGTSSNYINNVTIDDSLDIICIDSDPPTETKKINKAKNIAPIEVVDLVLSDSDDEVKTTTPPLKPPVEIISLDSPSPPPARSRLSSSSSSSSANSSNSGRSSVSTNSENVSKPKLLDVVESSDNEQPSSSIFEPEPKLNIPKLKDVSIFLVDNEEPCSSTTEQSLPVSTTSMISEKAKLEDEESQPQLLDLDENMCSNDREMPTSIFNTIINNIDGFLGKTNNSDLGGEEYLNSFVRQSEISSTINHSDLFACLAQTPNNDNDDNSTI